MYLSTFTHVDIKKIAETTVLAELKSSEKIQEVHHGLDLFRDQISHVHIFSYDFI